ncbi:MAG TPA: prepilin-type N-terminal cleavage/methylation domain-containing protein [Candidatus Saccharimonadales bacterium]|nr:prepilin-type N-terminal cleavage/methylation domain-containing protein [Candidatus Saccharimonadales bacterium]
MKNQNGFTALEIIIAIVVIVAAGAFFYFQKRDLVTANLDTQRKTTANTLYHNLEAIYYPTYGFYPEVITLEQFKGLTPSLLTDPAGIPITEATSTLRYEPYGCNVEGKCRGYTLVALLDNEANFVKISRN